MFSFIYSTKCLFSNFNTMNYSCLHSCKKEKTITQHRAAWNNKFWKNKNKNSSSVLSKWDLLFPDFYLTEMNKIHPNSCLNSLLSASRQISMLFISVLMVFVHLETLRSCCLSGCMSTRQSPAGAALLNYKTVTQTIVSRSLFHYSSRL